MSYAADVAKEYLCDALHSGALDITTSFKQVRGFVQIFAGEMEAIIAITLNYSCLTPEELDQLWIDAKPPRAAVLHFRAWHTRTTGTPNPRLDPPPAGRRRAPVDARPRPARLARGAAGGSGQTENDEGPARYRKVPFSHVRDRAFSHVPAMF